VTPDPAAVEYYRRVLGRHRSETAGATLAAVGVTDPYERRAVLAILWGTR